MEGREVVGPARGERFAVHDLGVGDVIVDGAAASHLHGEHVEPELTTFATSSCCHVIVLPRAVETRSQRAVKRRRKSQRAVETQNVLSPGIDTEWMVDPSHVEVLMLPDQTRAPGP